MTDATRLAFAADALRRSPLFQSLTDARLDELSRSFRPRRYRRGEVIFHRGDVGDTLHLIESGLVKISEESLTGSEAFINTLHPGATFGELGLIDGAERSATATALEPTITLVLPRAPVIALIDNDRAFRHALLAALANELRRVTGRLAELHFLDLPGRLAVRLAAMAQEAEPDRNEEVRLGRAYTQSELASMIGGTRQSVNRHLGELVDDGLIRLEPDDIVVINVAELHARGEW
ncbi:MAG TPA: Crp/Fnr family transcriptional regulator [Candidatus Limnocylindrales bacterium]|nr:Crp/Fnr family transcriptional regulator [Candidatus Limnocylindrales bacterium]